MGNVCLYPDQYRNVYRLLVVQRDKPGYTPSTHGLFPTEEKAWAKAMTENMDMGVWTRDEVMEIVESSIMAQDLRDGTNLMGRA